MSEIYHHGIKGMKWGVRKNRKKTSLYKRALDKSYQRVRDKEKAALIADSKNVIAKAPTGKHVMVPGKYHKKRGGYDYMARHIVNDLGQVKMSYFRGTVGDITVAAGRDYVSKLDLRQFFRSTNNLNIEYDVYD